ncbi:MAG TPA: arsenate reductase ArsC [Bacteroidia bacterium]|jgi:arsenate reductase|nr:arsenate reductase ArsC [Bacteroidia bacterium]HQF29251.1 arsenate reductase ArsC [Bacteroidia bacterium]HQK97930.1 arsenate reductase ArsC [Bacteroidia bacterium]
MKNILVLCTGNSCRSQIAEGYLQHFGADAVKVYSAGVETHGVNPRAIEIMREDGIDISHHTSNLVDEYIDIPFDLILTVCDNAKERCPYFPSKAERIHYSFSDPAKATGTEEEIKSEFRKVRNEIKEYTQIIMHAMLAEN